MKEQRNENLLSNFLSLEGIFEVGERELTEIDGGFIWAFWWKNLFGGASVGGGGSGGSF